MQYKVLGYNSKYGSLYVQFSDLDIDQTFEFNIDIPIENGKFISDEALDIYIKSFSPVSQINRIKEIKNNNLTKPAFIEIIEVPEPTLIPENSSEQANL